MTMEMTALKIYQSVFSLSDKIMTDALFNNLLNFVKFRNLYVSAQNNFKNKAALGLKI